MAIPSAVWIGSRERQNATWRLDSSTSEVLVIRPEIVTFWFGLSRGGRAGVTASMLTRAHDSGSAAWAAGAAGAPETGHRDQQGGQQRPYGPHPRPHVTRWIVVIGPG